MNTEYYQKYLKYKKKYLDLKNLQYNLENQQGAWEEADPSGVSYLEGLRTYYDLSDNPDDTKRHISNAWPTYKLTDRYKMADDMGNLHNLYVTDYVFPLNDMSNKFGYTKKSVSISTLDVSYASYAKHQIFQGLAQIYFANTIRDMSNIVNKYLTNPETNFSDLSKTYHDLSHDIKQKKYYFIPTRESLIKILGARYPALTLYHDRFYGFDVSSTKPDVDDESNGLIQGIYDQNNARSRLEYLMVDLTNDENRNIRDTEEHNLKILQLLMYYHEAKSDGVLKDTEIARINAQITTITNDLTNERNRANFLLSDLEKNKNESALAKQVRDKEIKSLKEEREKRNNAISKLGNYLLGKRKNQTPKSNVITLNSFFGLN